MENTHVSFNPASSDLCVFLWTDSSPQAGTDWLLTQMRIIPPGKLSKRRAPCHGLQVGDGVYSGQPQRISRFSPQKQKREKLDSGRDPRCRTVSGHAMDLPQTACIGSRNKRCQRVAPQKNGQSPEDKTAMASSGNKRALSSFSIKKKSMQD